MRPGETGRRPDRRRAGAGCAVVACLLPFAVACSAPPGPVAVPDWFRPETSWRPTAPTEQKVALDLAVNRSAQAYRGRFGAGTVRVFTVAAPRRCADALAAVDTVMAAREAVREEGPALRDGEQETQWTADGRTVVLACLEGPGVPAGAPAFVVVVDPA